ncbi:MAG: hypothetical protein HZC54_22505 [Verrucomicrobia bacterium]|nr:hypothetical protein [Verrucomicrobiota bacterium]
MPTFDANHPQNGDEVEADLLRNNFNALNDRDGELAAQIAAIPAGQQGPPGEPGPAGPAGADSTVPGPAGADGRGIANVRDNGDGRVVIDMSDYTSYGPFYAASGPPGATGAPGEPGPGFNLRGDWDAWTGYARADVVAYNGNLYVAFADGLSGPPPDMDARWRLLTITGPAGAAGGPGPQGDPGPAGSPGNDGAQGPAGPQGEVSAQQLTDAINDTARNPAGIGPFTGDFSENPTQSEMRAFRDWANAFFGAAAR